MSAFLLFFSSRGRVLFSYYRRPGGVFRYRRPDGTSLYRRP